MYKLSFRNDVGMNLSYLKLEVVTIRKYEDWVSIVNAFNIMLNVYWWIFLGFRLLFVLLIF